MRGFSADVRLPYTAPVSTDRGQQKGTLIYRAGDATTQRGQAKR